jgi:hypothetical protein
MRLSLTKTCSIAAAILSLPLVVGCRKTETRELEMTQTTDDGVPVNQRILDEVNSAGVWFHAKKVRPIWATRVAQAQTVETLEGSETVREGDYLCRGVQNEIWPQTAEKLQQKYDATDTADEEGWRQYRPKPDAKGVMAAQIDHPFSVQAAWGELSGKAGDYLVKSFEDRDVDYPEDVWIVDRGLFAATYEKVD